MAALAATVVLAAPASASGPLEPYATPAVETLLQQQDPVELTAWGRRHVHGEGVARNPEAAVKLLCRAARAGHTEAQYELGVLYFYGRGVDRDDTLAAAWLGLAAREDDHAGRLLRRVARHGEVEGQPRCVLPGGGEYLAPLRSVPDPTREQVLTWVEHLAPEYGLDPELVAAVIRTESNFNPRARSHKDARGLMQLIPATAERFGVKDIWDPVENLRGGLAYLRWLMDRFDGNVPLALAGYNAGENAVARYRGIPPYAETRRYVKLITERVGLQTM